MPGFNGTGPLGFGPRTGRGMGPCGGGYGCGRGWGRGLGRFFGFRKWSAEDEKQALEQTENYLKEELKVVQNRLNEISE